MARYIATSGSHFNPLDYDTLMKPIQALQEQHDIAADTYDTLNLETEAIRQYITENPGDKRALQIYNDYSQKLNALQSDLWENGVTTQTRRRLSDARASFAGIGKVKNAIQNRQKRSQEYWDARHKDPSLVTGGDPALSGLDNYLDNELYGQDWYSYSGNQFMSEVGIDAKARANEMMRNPELMKNPELAGYITRITQEGFTSAEVENASALARQILDTGNTSALERAGLPETILASVLLSHLESTGARGKVSDAEFNRLFDYGRAGLSQAIGKTDIRDLKDNNWELAAQKSLARYTQSLKNPKPTGGNERLNSPLPYTLNDIASYMEAENAKRINNTLGGKFIEPFKEPIIVNNPDGTTDLISSPMDAERILNSFGREKIYNEYGINPDSPIGKATLPSGREIQVSSRSAGYANPNAHYDIQMKDGSGQWVTQEEMSNEFNALMNEYRSKLDAWKNGNKNVNLQKLAITDKQREKIYNEYGIPDNVPLEDIPYILQVKSGQEYVTPATIAGSTIDMDSTRKNYTRQIITSFSRESDNKGKVAKTSPFAIYPVDGYNISDKGIQDIKDVLADNKGNIRDDTVTEIVVYPEDLDKNKVRFTANGRQYAVDASMLGNDMNYQIQRLKEPVDYMMTPLFDPVAAMQMTTDENAQWAYQIANMLGDYINPAIVDNSGNIVGFITPRMVVQNQELQGKLRTAVTRFMNNVLADPRDNMMLNNYQVRGNTSTKATGYNDYTE